jgi:hypothetical protein
MAPTFAQSVATTNSTINIIITSRENRFYFESYQAADSSSLITNYQRTRRALHALFFIHEAGGADAVVQ